MVDPRDIAILQNGKDRRELKKTAIKWGKGADPDAHANLRLYLDNAGFLNRLDDAAAYDGGYTGLRLASVIRVLMLSHEPSAHDVLVGLTTAKTFLRHPSRIMLLIRALAEVRPSPPEAIQFWNRYSSADSPLLYNVVEALCINQSDPAMDLLEQKFTHLQLSDESLKRWWMHVLILPRRNDDPLLRCCLRILHSDMPMKHKLAMAEALFDYQPDAWYVGCDRPDAPSHQLASDSGKALFDQIGQYALNHLALSDSQRQVIENVLQTL